MGFINVGKENSTSIDLYYEDHGMGKPIVLIHGWPLSSASWEKQLHPLLEAGYRVIAYDRRGFGYSSRPSMGYNYDVMAEDLHKIMTKLNLHDVTLVGFSMGGGEVARFLGKYGSDRVSKAVFISAITPFLLKKPDNQEGVEGSMFESMQQDLMMDRPAFLTKFLNDFYDVDMYKDKRVTDEVLWLSWYTGAMASPLGTIECVTAWGNDFRDDLRKIDIPALVIHGDADRICPLAACGKRMPEFVKDCKLSVINGAPHGMNWTHAEEMHKELMAFLKEERPVRKDKVRVGANLNMNMNK